MKVSTITTLFLCLCVFCASVESRPTEHSSSVEETDSDTEFVQANPGYVEPEDRDDSEDESDDEREDEEDSKSALAKALAKSRKAPRRTIRFVQKHKMELTIAVAVFAFRREIGFFLWNALSKPVRDPQSGQIVGRKLPMPGPTSILKVLLFVNVMRRLQRGGGGDEKSTGSLLSFLFRGNPVLAILLMKLLSPSNSAYVPSVEQHFTFERVNDRYKKDGLALEKAMDPASLRSGGRNSTLLAEAFKKSNTTASSESDMAGARSALLDLLHLGTHGTSYNETVVLMDLTSLDSSVSQMSVLRDEVSFLLSEYRSQAMEKELPGNNTTSESPELEVVVLLESPGGSASDYALASQQILRLRQEPGIQVTVCVDKVAASGGYMIACCSSKGRLFAAPFAVLGSIGVVGQSVNIQKTLEGWGVRPLVFRGGRDKAPVGLIGDVTEEGMAKVQGMVDATHRAFKRHVMEARPVVSPRIDEISTGDIWLGYDAVELGLIDRLVTSDEYIGERLKSGARVLKLVQMQKPKFPFARPSTTPLTSQSQDPSIAEGLRSVTTTLGSLQTLIEKATQALGTFLSSDVQAVTRAATTTTTPSAKTKSF